MKKLTLSILFVVLTATQAFAGPPVSKSLRTAFEIAKAKHQSEMKAIELEANLMSEVTREESKSPEAVANVSKETKNSKATR